MLDIFNQLIEWEVAGRKAAIATVVKTWGSAPRPIGSSMAVNENGEIIGSVSGGCVEGKVSEAALEVIASGNSKLLSFGVSDSEAWSVGLSCGGKIDVFISPALWQKSSDDWKQLKEHVLANQAACLITDLNTGTTQLINQHSTHNSDLETLGKLALSQRKNMRSEDANYFADLFPRKSQLIIIGAAHITVDLVYFAKSFGFETIVIDPRGFFVDNTQFQIPPDACIQDWPAEVLNNYPLDQFTYTVTLSHDPKIDDQALQILLKSKVAYIGALGSKKTHVKRLDRLREAGIEEELLSKIQAPVGVDINAKTPKEIALSVISQIIQAKNKFL